MAGDRERLLRYHERMRLGDVGRRKRYRRGKGALVELILFHYTLLVLLLSIAVAAVCLSAYLVSHKRAMLLLCASFTFYFFDIAFVFQDEFIAHVTGMDLSAVYMVVRSLSSLVTGGGFITAMWWFVCDYLDEERRGFLVVPPAVYVAASLVALFAIPASEMQRFCFWSMHQFYMYWILGFLGYRALTTKNQAERVRLHRHRGVYVLAWVLSLAVLAEDAYCFLVLGASTIQLGAFEFTTERNYAENLLMIALGIVSVRAAWRILSLRFERPPAQGGTKQQEQQIVENLNVFAQRHKLSPREREVLYLVLLGKDNQNIASEMSLALSTVKVHVHNILKKTGSGSRQELMQDFWKMS